MTPKKNLQTEKDSEMSQIEALQKIIAEAEKTITATKQKLAQIQGSEKISNRLEARNDDVGNVVYGVFDGQVMIGEDGKQYPVPANYASKSKLVENDMLKLAITPNGNFIYKQVGPVDRRYLIGIVERDERGNFLINSEGKKYKTLLAAATYFKVDPGDEVTLVVPRDKDSIWCAIENVLRKADDINENEINNEIYERLAEVKKNDAEQERRISERNLINEEEDELDTPSAIERLEREMEEERKKLNALKRSEAEKESEDLTDEEIASLKEEASYPAIEK